MGNKNNVIPENSLFVVRNAAKAAKENLSGTQSAFPEGLHFKQSPRGASDRVPACLRSMSFGRSGAKSAEAAQQRRRNKICIRYAHANFSGMTLFLGFGFRR
jgi:hypothetical protein